jgi:hypothetical protein
MDHDVAMARLEEVLSEHPDVSVRIAWRTIGPIARRARRISSTVLPRVIDVAQHAIAARNILDALFPALPTTAFTDATKLREHLLAIIDAQSTGAREDETPSI